VDAGPPGRHPSSGTRGHTRFILDEEYVSDAVTGTHRILMICGSLRAGSTNAAVLHTAQALAPDGMAAEVYAGLNLLPHFNPDDDREPLHPAVADLRAVVGTADAVVLSTPEYAGALPGSLKNFLEWTVGSGGLYEKPVMWINVSATTGAVHAHASLRTVLGYAGANIVEDACAHIPVPRHAVGPDGTVDDPQTRARVAAVLGVLAAHLDGTGPRTRPVQL
jgi:NAD(P)H-dependent FMN reductase